MSGPDHSDRRFLLEAGLLALLLVAGALALAELRSDRGWRWRVDGGSRVDLTREAEGPFERRDGGMLIGDGIVESTTVRLAPVDVEAGGRYLLTLCAGAGRAVKVGGVVRPSGQRVHFRFSARGQGETYRRVLDYGSRVRLHLAVVARGPEPVVIESLTLHRISSARETFLGLLPAIGLLLVVLFGWRHHGRLRRALREPAPADDALFAVALLVFCFMVFLRAPVQQMMDGRGVTAVSHALLHSGKLSVDAEMLRTEFGAEPYWLHSVDGEVFHYAYTPVAVLETPFVWLHELFGVSPVGPGGFDRNVEIGILRRSSALLAAALCAVLYALARLRLPPWAALALTAAFAFGTQVFSTISRPYWSHAWATLLIALALLLVLAPWSARRRLAAAAAASLATTATVCRPSMALSTLALVALLGSEVPVGDRRRIYLGTLAFFGLAGALAHWLLLDSLVPLQFLRFHTEWGLGPTLRLYPGGLAGSLVSPARGAFVYVPLFAWVLWMVVRNRRELGDRRLAITALIVIGLHWQVLVISRVWSDGQAFGSRLFSDVLVWFFVLAVLVVGAMLRRTGRKGAPLELATLAFALGASLFVNGRGAFAPSTWRWDWLDRPPAWVEAGEEPPIRPPRVWNWRYPQFMAGLLPRETDGAELREKIVRERGEPDWLREGGPAPVPRGER